MPMAEKRAIVITGASSGIGRALALAAARAGYRVLATARRAELLDDLAIEIRASGGECVTLAGDVTAVEMPPRLVAAAMQAFGRIDAIVNNAGVGASGSLLDTSDAELDAQWRLHVLAPLRLARASLPELERRRGMLAFIGSGIARVPLPNYGGYALAKAAIRAAAIQLRRELKSRGIGVTYVDPGVVVSEFHSRLDIERPPLAVPAGPVARAILRGIARRSAVVNAVPWQTAATALGEWSGTLADSLVIKHVTPTPRHPPPYHPEPFDSTSTGAASLRASSVEGQSGAGVSFDRALEPAARRMERVKLSPAFLRDALVPGATLELNVLAMRWAGMPNKNERAALHEALDALESAGYLERLEEETWKVLRAAG
jgi:short-subunit dehydrogenase